MQISINRDELLKPLSYVAGVVERRQTLPILSNVKLRCYEGILELTGTDLEVEVITTVRLDGAQEGGYPYIKVWTTCGQLLIVPSPHYLCKDIHQVLLHLATSLHTN